ncbi:hypothetical protein QCN29_32215 [Streptomyces sp. HNM0663]|uniref:Uncharacterized protein n=1 Tax=Streptomyces chengmaiensis TaxID=3040919 RepID=A0ABT6HZT8_9ACTN|nr:hypothetical protein [Streptomyces chengmaiensis]MDH2393349.1 hypothetical protein [Streptomyces chengmaiensis]
MNDTTPTGETARTDAYAAEIRALVDAAPPLSVRQRERLRLVFKSRPLTADSDARPGRAQSGEAA